VSEFIMPLSSAQQDQVMRALDSFRIELPSWAFADTGTRFGKFTQPAAAVTFEEKASDAGEVHRFTGSCPTMAIHVLWDFPNGVNDVAVAKTMASRNGIAIGSISPNIFQDQEYKYGSVGNPDPAIRGRALDHILDCVEIAKAAGSRDITPWFADGSNYPGTANIRQRRAWFEDSLKRVHDALSEDQRLLVEYKPFEPAFYHTDVADWGMAYLLAKAAGPKAKVLVDTGHHYQAQNIEQIVAWLLHDEMLGGFHFNDRRYADDDLTLGSIDPYQVFRIFHEIHLWAWEMNKTPDIAYMVDQSHNLKPKIEEMIQTVVSAQELYAKAALVDHGRLAQKQKECALIDAEETLKRAFRADVEPAIVEWRRAHGLVEDPLEAFRASGYTQRITAERGARKRETVSSYA
jgi:L-rhamnose isomerase/sugar isomerase